MLNPPFSASGDAPQHIVPFYSGRTLERLHDLVKELDGGLAVYLSKDHGFATIGTRGIRPVDRAAGLIIHLSIRLRDEDTESSVILDPPIHNAKHTAATPDQLLALLLKSLEEAALLPADFSKDELQTRCF